MEKRVRTFIVNNGLGWYSESKGGFYETDVLEATSLSFDEANHLKVTNKNVKIYFVSITEVI